MQGMIIRLIFKDFALSSGEYMKYVSHKTNKAFFCPFGVSSITHHIRKILHEFIVFFVNYL